MKELNDLIDHCYNLYTNNKCTNCANNNFCIGSCDCDICLRHIFNGNPPSFHYPCERITYYYTLRFFDRFASEILRLFLHQGIKFDKKNYYFVSLGCGPGSEIYGIVEGLRRRLGNDFTLKYRGYDTNEIWKGVQQKTEDLFKNSNCDVTFHATDMITNWQDTDNCEIFALVMNYLLSDCQKYMQEEDLNKFLDSIVSFILQHKIKFLVFNDINYYGYKQFEFDSGTKCMEYIIKRLEKLKDSNLLVKKLQPLRVCYPNDRFIPSGWKEWDNSNLLMNTDTQKTAIANAWSECRSKYIIARIEYLP